MPMTSAQTAGQKRKGRNWTIRPPRVVTLIEARQVAEQAVRVIEAIPQDLADQLMKELDEASHRISEERSKRDLAFGLKILLDCTAHNGHPKAADRDGALRLLQEIQTQPKPHVTLPGPARPGYVKEIVMKYRLRPIPYGAQLTGGFIRCSGDVLKLFSNLRYEPKEHVIAVHLNNGNQILSVNHVATGTMSSCPVNSGELFRDAILAGAAAVIVVHNHPSGKANPSAGDLALMDELRRVGELLHVVVTDFVVLGDDSHWSASDRGVLRPIWIRDVPPLPVPRRPTPSAVKGRRGQG
jgi:hypothetical protein